MKKTFSLQAKEKKHVLKKEISCCFTGHRTVGEDLNVDELKSVIKRVAQQGYTRFLAATPFERMRRTRSSMSRAEGSCPSWGCMCASTLRPMSRAR